MSLVPIFLTGWAKGLQTNKKPLLLPDQAFETLENAYVWRERVKKREGIKLLGRLRRCYTTPVTLNTQANGASYTNTDILNDPSIDVRTDEPNAQIEPGSLSITVGAITFDDNGDGTLTGTPGTNSGTINYATGELTLSFSPALGVATNVDVEFCYFPMLPVMGILQYEQVPINDEKTLWFDRFYAYTWTGLAFQEFIPGTTWNGSDSDFFWGCNYRGPNPEDKLFFVTNFFNDAGSPIRYTNGLTWTDFNPYLTQATPPNPATDTKLYQARIIVSYYGRLLFLNTWEGTENGGYGGAKNIQNRCRFSQLGDPTAVDAFRSDIFGKGGFIDAPTTEQITGATFIKNTLIVDFERTTWQLRYVGEYGLPFIWERVSADFGSESTFSGVLFDNFRLTVGDVGITSANAIGVERIDLDIPDQVFIFKNSENGVKRVFGVRDYQKEVIYWNYPDSNTQAADGVPLTFPNRVLLYNYRNQSWAIFRDNVTAFGTFQETTGTDENILWDRTDIFWDDESVLWDDITGQSKFDAIVSGNQQGFVHRYGYTTSLDSGSQASLSITAVDLTLSPIQLTIPDHNLEDSEVIYVQDLQFVDSVTFLPLSTDLNDNFYIVQIIDKDTVALLKWNGTIAIGNFPFTPVTTAIYVGGGVASLIPKLNVITKDFNIFQNKGLQTKMSYIDFMMQPTEESAMTVNILINASPSVSGNMLVGNRNLGTVLTTPFYVPQSDYAPFRFYTTLSAYFFRIQMTYDNTLMTTLSTHEEPWTLYQLQAWCRPGGKNQF